MPQAICDVADCDAPVRTRYAKWCNRHYFRWYRHGDPLADHTVHRPTCSVDDCDRPHRGHGYCIMHLYRYQRHGDPNYKRAEGTITSEGYRVVTRRDHPLAAGGASPGRVMEHRLVLYETIGPGDHHCHWCNRLVLWERSWPKDADALVVDHLDGDRLNNDPVNLKASCGVCNLKR